MPAKGGQLSDEAKAKISAARHVPKIQCTCKVCGTVFEKHRSEVKRGEGVFCGKKCEGVFRTGKPLPAETCQKRSVALKGRVISPEWRAKISASMMGKQNAKKGKPITERQRERQRAAMVGRKHTKEHNEKIRCNTPRAENSPHWQGGKSFGKYCPKFNNEFRNRVRAFFNYTCIECGEPQDGEKLGVHHILYNKKACCDDTMPMFAPLCRSCHAKTNFNRKMWENKFASIITNYYGGRSFLTKEEMRDWGG